MKRLIGVAAFALALATTACESREGPVERNAEKVGREADQLRPGTQNADEAGEKAKDRLDEAGDKVEDTAKEARDDVRK